MAKAVNINIDEAALIEQCQQGDSSAMEHLILKYRNRIYNVILKMCANADDAAELTQETFVKILENIGEFESRSGFYTWAFRIAVNLTINYCKRNAKFLFRSLDADNDERYWQAKVALKDFLRDERSPDPAIVAQNKELSELIIKGLMKLDDSQRAVIVLRDIEGMNYAQIAEIFNVELGTIKSRLSRARNNLREIMEATLQ